MQLEADDCVRYVVILAELLLVFAGHTDFGTDGYGDF